MRIIDHCTLNNNFHGFQESYLYVCLTIFILNFEVAVVEVYGGHHGVAGVYDGADSRREERQLMTLEVFTSKVQDTLF